MEIKPGSHGIATDGLLNDYAPFDYESADWNATDQFTFNPRGEIDGDFDIQERHRLSPASQQDGTVVRVDGMSMSRREPYYPEVSKGTGPLLFIRNLWNKVWMPGTVDAQTTSGVRSVAEGPPEQTDGQRDFFTWPDHFPYVRSDVRSHGNALRGVFYGEEY
jgi:hypothetical protein